MSRIKMIGICVAAAFTSLAVMSSSVLATVAPSPGAYSEFPLPRGNGPALEIIAGPDGNLWFTEQIKCRMASPWHGNESCPDDERKTIGRITPSGTISEFRVPGPTELSPLFEAGIATGPDGNLWLAGDIETLNGKVDLRSGLVSFPSYLARVTTAGMVSELEFPLPARLGESIVAGPDGNLWATNQVVDGPGVSAGMIARIVPGGTIAQFPVPAQPRSLIAGPDGNLWFTEAETTPHAGVNFGSRKQIGRITPGGVVTSFALHSAPSAIAAGPDGNVWFAGNRLVNFARPGDELEEVVIGRVGPGRAVSEFPLLDFAQLAGSSNVDQLTAGPDGNLWFTRGIRNVGRITPGGVIDEFAIPAPPDAATVHNPLIVTSGPHRGVTKGSDGNVWFTDAGLCTAHPGFIPGAQHGVSCSRPTIGRLDPSLLPAPRTKECVVPNLTGQIPSHLHYGRTPLAIMPNNSPTLKRLLAANCRLGPDTASVIHTKRQMTSVAVVVSQHPAAGQILPYAARVGVKIKITEP